jgi:hypothetical protein
VPAAGTFSDRRVDTRFVRPPEANSAPIAYVEAQMEVAVLPADPGFRL